MFATIMTELNAQAQVTAIMMIDATHAKAHRTASFLLALPCRTCPMARPSMLGKTMHHQTPGSNT
jgi:hypothetical protein